MADKVYYIYILISFDNTTIVFSYPVSPGYFGAFSVDGLVCACACVCVRVRGGAKTFVVYRSVRADII